MTSRGAFTILDMEGQEEEAISGTQREREREEHCLGGAVASQGDFAGRDWRKNTPTSVSFPSHSNACYRLNPTRSQRLGVPSTACRGQPLSAQSEAGEQANMAGGTLDLKGKEDFQHNLGLLLSHPSTCLSACQSLPRKQDLFYSLLGVCS